MRQWIIIKSFLLVEVRLTIVMDGNSVMKMHFLLFSLQICKNFAKFVQIICTICTKSFALYKAILYLTIATKIAILQTFALIFCKIASNLCKKYSSFGAWVTWEALGGDVLIYCCNFSFSWDRNVYLWREGTMRCNFRGCWIN